MEGDFIIPSCQNGQTTFSFAFENSFCENANDFIQLQVDGNIVWNHNANPGNCDTPGTIQLISLDFSAYADNTSHNLLFNSSVANGSATNFTIDNIKLLNEGCNADIICKYVVDATYNCHGGSCVTNLNLTNPHNSPTTYRAAVNIQSTSTVNANVNYRAGVGITLNSGFRAKANYDFSADIEGCD